MADATIWAVTDRHWRGGARTTVVALAATVVLLPAWPAAPSSTAATAGSAPFEVGSAGIEGAAAGVADLALTAWGRDGSPVAQLPAGAPRPHQQLAPLGAVEAWRYSTGEGIVVAVLDSGVAADHPALAGRVLPGVDYVDGSTDGTSDPVGHGTAVASLIAGYDGEMAVGLAPGATILPVRVLDAENKYDSATTVAEGVRWAVTHGADVINLSLGGLGYSTALAEALDFAMTNDVVVIACTGNGFGPEATTVWYPAREPGVVAVSGLVWLPDGQAGTWEGSVTGPETVLAAPAVVDGAHPDGTYRAVQGTSFAAALVTGTAALVRARYPHLSAGDVVNRLMTTARDLGPAGRDPAYGFGALDPVAALTADVAPVSGNPLDTKVRHGTGRFGPAPAPDDETPPEADERTTPAPDDATVPPDATATPGDHEEPDQAPTSD